MSPSDRNAVDELAGSGMRKLAARVSRRGLGGLLAKVAVLVGAGAAGTAIPIDRRVHEVDASHNCSHWEYCGLHGYPCGCCGAGADCGKCPSGTVLGSNWIYCCYNGSQWRLIKYTDCCGSSGCGGCVYCNNSAEPSWCVGAGSGIYLCTQICDIGSCE